jgi:hypothetical protein
VRCSLATDTTRQYLGSSRLITNYEVRITDKVALLVVRACAGSRGVSSAKNLCAKKAFSESNSIFAGFDKNGIA